MMVIQDKENQFQGGEIALPEDRNFFVIVGANNSGKTTFLRTLLKNDQKQTTYLVTVNRTVLTGEGATDKNYIENYTGYSNTILNREDDNFERQTRPLQDYFALKDVDRKPIKEWYNSYFPNKLVEEREDPQNSASPMLLKVNGFPITKQGSGIRATLEIFIKLFDSRVGTLCIDEPEIGLEPVLQKHLFRALKEKAGPNKKIILATHSHHFLDTEDIGSNFRCQRNSDNKIFITPVDDLQPVVFRLLGNTLSSYLLPERILILEGPSDATYLSKVLSLMSKSGYAVHSSGSNSQVGSAASAVTQFIRFNKNNLPVYKERLFVIVDNPEDDVLVRLWRTLISDDQRLQILREPGIEYYYPEHLLQEVFGTKNNKKNIVDAYLRSNPNSYNGVQLSKNQLSKVVSEKLQHSDLQDSSNELFTFLNALP